MAFGAGTMVGSESKVGSRMSCVRWVAAVLVAAGACAPHASAQTCTTVRVSVASSGEEADAATGLTTMSRDGRYVAFNSGARNLVFDNNATDDVFLHDNETGKTWRISEGTGGIEGDGPSSYPSMTLDARIVVFSSWARNLVPNDTNNVNDVFLRDRVLETTERISVAPGGVQADGGSYQGVITPDGRFVVFMSFASNLVANDTNLARDVFLLDRTTGAIERVNVSGAGAESAGPAGGNVGGPELSDDGRYVAFSSIAGNLASGDTNGSIDVYVRDRTLGTTTRLTLGLGGAEPDGDCDLTSMSADGRFIAFSSNASNLVANDNNGTTDAFVVDRITGVIERVSVSTSGQEGSLDTWSPAISDDGRFVAYLSTSPDLVVVDVNGKRDVFLHDRLGHTTELFSTSGPAAFADADCNGVSINGDGSVVAFSTASTMLVPNDTNGIADAFVHECRASTPFCTGTASACPCGNAGAGSAGCANAITPGVFLQTLGQASVAVDTLTLVASSVPPNAPVMFLQGLGFSAGGFPFGDGLRCVSGATTRLALRFASSGTLMYGFIGTDPLLSVQGAVALGGDWRYYQAWYRSPQAFCTSATFNLSNGASVLWSP
jgi:Tol biopolymer transport system component